MVNGGIILAYTLCPKCQKGIPDNANECPECGHKIYTTIADVKATTNKKKNNPGCMIAIVVAIIIFVIISQISSENYKRDELQSFEDQMHKDPSTWTQEEKERYYDFMEWTSEQQESKN